VLTVFTAVRATLEVRVVCGVLAGEAGFATFARGTRLRIGPTTSPRSAVSSDVESELLVPAVFH
jgi:hypothetical protein